MAEARKSPEARPQPAAESPSPHRTPAGKRLVTLETLQTTIDGTAGRLNSPRSLEACRRAGIDPDTELVLKPVSNFMKESGYSPGAVIADAQQASTPRRRSVTPTGRHTGRSASVGSSVRTRTVGTASAVSDRQHASETAQLIALQRFEHSKKRYHDTVAMLLHVRKQIIDQERKTGNVTATESKSAAVSAHRNRSVVAAAQAAERSQVAVDAHAAREDAQQFNVSLRRDAIDRHKAIEADEKVRQIEWRQYWAKQRREEAMNAKSSGLASGSTTPRRSGSVASSTTSSRGVQRRWGGSGGYPINEANEEKAKLAMQRANYLEEFQRHKAAAENTIITDRINTANARREVVQRGKTTNMKHTAAGRDAAIAVAKERRKHIDAHRLGSAQQTIKTVRNKQAACAERHEALQADALACRQYNQERIEYVKHRQQMVEEVKRLQHVEMAERMMTSKDGIERRREVLEARRHMEAQARNEAYEARMGAARARAAQIKQFTEAEVAEDVRSRQEAHALQRREREREKLLAIEARRLADEDKALSTQRARRALQYMDETDRAAQQLQY